MRVLPDTNIFISYLLTPLGHSPVNTLVHAAFTDAFRLLLAADVLDELQCKVTTKPYLAQRIAATELEILVDALLVIAEVIPSIEEPFPEVGRDRKDDYVLAYAVVGQADYLVTGDDDLLTLVEVAGVKIVSPREFAQFVENGPGYRAF